MCVLKKKTFSLTLGVFVGVFLFGQEMDELFVQPQKVHVKIEEKYD